MMRFFRNLNGAMIASRDTPYIVIATPLVQSNLAKHHQSLPNE